MKLKVTVNGIPYDIEVEVEENERPQLGPIVIGGSGVSVPSRASVPAAASNAVTAPLAGSVSRILVEQDQEIEAGQVLLVLEAMKMETEITAPHDGKIGEIHVAVGDAVHGGQLLLEWAQGSGKD